MQEPRDILKPLPFDEWSHLKVNLKRDWPHFAYYYYWVDNAVKWKTKEPNIKLNILCTEKKFEDGVFIGIEAYSNYIVVPFAFEESKSLLRDCLIETRLIDWTEGVIFGAVHEYFETSVRDAIEYLEKTIGLQLDENKPTDYYFKAKEDSQDVEVKVPADMKLKFLQDSDAQVVYDYWPRVECKRNREKSMSFVATAVRLNKGLGLFKKDDGKLVSWVLQNHWGGLGFLQTLDEHQGKGYGKIMVNALAKHLASEGLDVTLFIVEDNVVSEKLFSSLNFKKINVGTFIVIKPLSKR